MTLTFWACVILANIWIVADKMGIKGARKHAAWAVAMALVSLACIVVAEVVEYAR